jgi:hypothetical protein
VGSRVKGTKTGSELGDGFGGDGGKGSLGKVAPSGSGGSVGWEAATHVDLINGRHVDCPICPCDVREIAGLGAGRKRSKRGCEQSNRGTKPVVGSGGASGVQTATLAGCGVGSLGHRKLSFCYVPGSWAQRSSGPVGSDE